MTRRALGQNFVVLIEATDYGLFLILLLIIYGIDTMWIQKEAFVRFFEWGYFRIWHHLDAKNKLLLVCEGTHIDHRLEFPSPHSLNCWKQGLSTSKWSLDFTCNYNLSPEYRYPFIWRKWRLWKVESIPFYAAESRLVKSSSLSSEGTRCPSGRLEAMLYDFQ